MSNGPMSQSVKRMSMRAKISMERILLEHIGDYCLTVKELKTMITKLSRLIFLSCSQLAFRVYVSLQLRSKNEFREDPQITWTQLNILLDGEGLRY